MDSFSSFAFDFGFAFLLRSDRLLLLPGLSWSCTEKALAGLAWTDGTREIASIRASLSVVMGRLRATEPAVYDLLPAWGGIYE